MSYHAVAPQSSNRSRLALVPLDLINAMVEPNADGARGRSSYVVVPTPGRRRLAELPGFCRGLYAKPGVQGGALFAAAGSELVTVSSAWASTSIGAIAGADPVRFADFRAALIALAGGTIYYRSDPTFASVTDGDAPSPPSAITTAGYRILASVVAGDEFGWSKAGLYNDWDPLGSAQAIDLPDPIVGLGQDSGDAIAFGSRSIARWRATGGAEDEAFSPMAGIVNMGSIGGNVITELDGGLSFVNDRGEMASIAGGAPTTIECRAFSDEFNRLSLLTRSAALGWGYQEGPVSFYGVRAVGLPRTYVLDRSTGLVHQRARYGYATTYDVGYTARAYDATVCASPESPYLWQWSRDVFDDDGDPIIRTMTVRAEIAEDMTIYSVALDIRVIDQPLSGQGLEPSCMITYSRDGGQTWSDDWGDVRVVPLPAVGQADARPGDWQFGAFTRVHGALFRIQISDPVRFAVQGLWLNEGVR